MFFIQKCPGSSNPGHSVTAPRYRVKWLRWFLGPSHMAARGESSTSWLRQRLGIRLDAEHEPLGQGFKERKPLVLKVRL